MSNHDFQSLRALIGDEADNNDNYYRDPEHITAIQADIVQGKKDNISVQLAKWIRQKKFGIDVREALARFIEWMSVLTNRLFEENAQIASQNDKLHDDIENFTTDFENRYNTQIAGNTNINEVIDARVPVDGEAHATLKERLDTMENKTVDSLGNIGFDDVGGGIRAHFKPQITAMTRKLDQHKNNINIGQLTDTHYTTRDVYWGPNNEAKMSLTHILNMGEVSDNLDFAVATGDNADPNIDKLSEAKKYNRDFATTFHTALKCPTALLKGNHDDNSAYLEGKTGVGLDYVMSDDDFAEVYQQDGSNGEIRNGNSNYFYIDIKGIRVIGLDSYDTLEVEDSDGNVKFPRLANSAFSAKQVKWLYEKALQTDLPIIVFTHCPLKNTWGGGSGISANHDAVRLLIEAYQTGKSGFITSTQEGYELELEYNFDKPHDVIACIYGHRHTDNLDKHNGINHVVSQNSFAANAPTTDENYVSYLNTDNEDSWSVFSIDTKTRTVNWLKFGRGTDTTFTY